MSADEGKLANMGKSTGFVMALALCGCAEVGDVATSGTGGGGGQGGSASTGGQSGSASISGSGGAGGEASSGGKGGGGPLETCGPMNPDNPQLSCQGQTQCDDNDDCTADRCDEHGYCCHSVVGGC